METSEEKTQNKGKTFPLFILSENTTADEKIDGS